LENITFETGAKTAGANNLVLSVLNDGDVYRDRLHCGWAMLQGAAHGRRSFRGLANDEANKQRKQFGSKFKASEITEAGKLIEKDTIEHCLETLRDNYDKGQNVTVAARQWFDNASGNTYFSCRVYIPQTDTPSGRIINIPFQYGYGDQWQWEARRVLEAIGIIEKNDKFYRELPINWNFEGVMLKRDMYEGIYIK